jgi:hypothetical protein
MWNDNIAALDLNSVVRGFTLHRHRGDSLPILVDSPKKVEGKILAYARKPSAATKKLLDCRR